MLRISNFLCVFLLFAFVACAQAATADGQARARLESEINKIFTILQTPEFVDKATRPAQRAKIEAVVAEIFDFEEFSLRTIGPRWQQFTPEQKKQFEKAFAALLKATYLDRVDGYGGEQVQYLGEQLSTKGDKVELRTTLSMKNGKTIPVFYRMLVKNGIWVVYDVIIENISLVMNYRTQFQELLLKASPEELTARILERAQKTRESIDAH